MRYFIAGVDDDGRSCLVDQRDMIFGEIMPGLAVDGLFKTVNAPLPSRPDGRGNLVDLGLTPQQCSWSLWRFDPGVEVTMHHTDTIDFDVILGGAVELVLDDGVHLLQVGDCVVMTGVDHGWRAGPEGCLISGTAIGTPPRT